MTNEQFEDAKRIKAELYEIEKTNRLLKKVYDDNRNDTLDNGELDTLLSKVSNIVEAFKSYKEQKFTSL